MTLTMVGTNSLNTSTNPDCAMAALLGNITLSGALSGSGGLTLVGTNALVLAGSNTYTGLTSITSGTLSLASPLAVQNSTVSVSSSGAVSFAQGITSPVFGGLAGAGNIALATVASSPSRSAPAATARARPTAAR